MVAKRITHEKFGAMLDRILDSDYKLEHWYPTIEDAMEMSDDPIKYYEFILWILESNPDRELTKDQQYVERYLQRLLKECTLFISAPVKKDPADAAESAKAEASAEPEPEPGNNPGTGTEAGTEEDAATDAGVGSPEKGTKTAAVA